MTLQYNSDITGILGAFQVPKILALPTDYICFADIWLWSSYRFEPHQASNACSSFRSKHDFSMSRFIWFSPSLSKSQHRKLSSIYSCRTNKSDHLNEFFPIYNARVQRLVNHLCLYKVNTHGPSCKCVFVHVLPGFRQQGGILVWRGGFRKVVKDS